MHAAENRDRWRETLRSNLNSDVLWAYTSLSFECTSWIGTPTTIERSVWVLATRENFQSSHSSLRFVPRQTLSTCQYFKLHIHDSQKLRSSLAGRRCLREIWTQLMNSSRVLTGGMPTGLRLPSLSRMWRCRAKTLRGPFSISTARLRWSRYRMPNSGSYRRSVVCGEAVDAIRLADAMFNRGSHVGETRYWKAWNEFRQRELTAARNDAGEARRLQPDAATTKLAGQIALELGQLDAAEEAFEDARSRKTCTTARSCFSSDVSRVNATRCSGDRTCYRIRHCASKSNKTRFCSISSRSDRARTRWSDSADS